MLGITAGLVSISGALYSSMNGGTPPAPGEVLAIVHQTRSQTPVAGAVVEVYTEGDALLTTLSARDKGRVHHALREGDYKLRVSHPRYGVEVRQVQVQAHETSEIRIAMMPRVPEPSPATATATDSPLKRFFRKLGLD
ncbi:MAG TPA: carboxypeptidase-like regulatory domain-containing protein [Methylomirabilota bacterium]|nr:carboxypeptidase-like regulatory domain-containing protein [Methylomirabilota bacterium]